MSLSLDEMADAITASIEEFDRAFLQTQVEVEPLPEKRLGVYGINADGDKHQLILGALQYARERGWLEALLTRLAYAGLENGGLIRGSIAATKNNAQLEAIVDAAAGFGHGDLFYKRFGAAMRWTAMILVDNKPAGTGVLVGPHLVLTAWHVVKKLFKQQGNQWVAEQLPATGAKHAARLQVEFDNQMTLVGDAIAPRNTLRIEAAQNWCVVSSPPHNDELQGLLPTNLSKLDGFWDYAVIRLQKAPGLERRWAEIKAHHVVPAAQSRVWLIQHPSGDAQRYSDNTVADVPKTYSHAVPLLRFVHSANSLPGSSGGPCFDRQLALFGIHQGEWPHPCLNPVKSIANRGVPVTQIAAHIAKTIVELPPLDVSEQPVFSLGAGKCEDPVVGCDSFVSTLWRLAASDTRRVIVIDGRPKTGKTFRTEVLNACLPDAVHLKIVVDATLFAKDTADRIATIIATTSGAAAPSFEKPDEFGATFGTWIAKDVWPNLATALDTARGERMVWLVFQNLDKSSLEGAGANDLLLAASDAAVSNAPWLRVVLDGFKGILPDRVEAATYWETASLPDEADVKQYLMRVIGQYVPPEEIGVEMAAGAISDQMQGAGAERKLSEMIVGIKNALKRYAEKAGVAALQGALT